MQWIDRHVCPTLGSWPASRFPGLLLFLGGAALALAVSVLPVGSAEAAMPAAQRQVLLDIYTSTNGAAWINNSGWNGAFGTECSWYGVTCDGAENVVSVNLAANNLTGTIPSLDELTALQIFWVNNNNLTGSIPSLSGLTNLRTFVVADNQLTGSIPEMGGLASLRTFIVRNNQLTGSIPPITGLSALYNFDVGSNQLTGSIPSLYGLTALQHLSVSSNQLTGSIPSISGLTALQSIDLSSNRLTGSIPSPSGLRVKWFYAHSNQLTGSIPSLSEAEWLRTFYVNDNQLTGSIPALSNMWSLVDLQVHSNQLTGSIPSFDEALGLKYFTAHTNQLTGSIPPLSQMTQLYTFDVHSNQLTGPVPAPAETLMVGYTHLCDNNLSSSGNAEHDASWDEATGIDWLACQRADAPTIGVAEAGNGQATINFSAATTGGKASGFIATSTPGGLTGTCATSPCSVTGLSNGTAYAFVVAATNAAGAGAVSAASNSVTPATVPGAPIIGNASAGVGMATVSFTAPGSDGGSAIIGYTATSSPGGRTSIGCTASPCTVSDLTGGTDYTFTVRATNAVGSGAVSSASNSVTVITVPDAPLIGTASAGDGMSIVSFTPPAGNGGSAITGYKVYSSPSGYSGQCVSSPCIVNGLTNGVSYVFAVRAFNQVGNGAASSYSNSVTPTAELQVTDHYLWNVPSAANTERQGFLRLINRNDLQGEVTIWGLDAEGNRSTGIVTLVLGALEARQINSQDLEFGNVDKGLSGSMGAGNGPWTIIVRSSADVDTLAYIRTPDGFLTAMHDRALGDGVDWVVPFFNPALNTNQVSHLRLINTRLYPVGVQIYGIDDTGSPSVGTVTVTIAGLSSIDLSSVDLESGKPELGLIGSLGVGSGKWQLLVSATGRLIVQSLLFDPVGKLTNLSTLPDLSKAGAGHRTLWFVPPASNENQQGFVRLINRSDQSGTVSLRGIDDDGQLSLGTAMFTLAAKASLQLNSQDLEWGNPSKGLTGSLGDGNGSWRLLVTSELDIWPMSFIRTPDGFLTSVHDVVSGDGFSAKVLMFNPAENTNQVSVLRLVNPNSTAVAVTLQGTDDAGIGGPGGMVSLTLAAGTSVELTAVDLESGNAAKGIDGRLGNGSGKWRLDLTATAPIKVLNLLRDPNGFLTNLSTDVSSGNLDP